MRRAHVERKTNETVIRAVLNIDGRGKYKVSTGIRFFDHMLELFARHGGFDLELRPGATLTWTSITRWRMSASFWVKHLTKRWAPSGEFYARDIS